MRTGLRPAILVVAACGCVAGSIVSACIVAPPAVLAPSTPGRPTILHGSVTPPAYQPLTSWTSSTSFVVPVQLADINQSFVWAVFVDWDGNVLSHPTLTPGPLVATPGQLDAGVDILEFLVDPVSNNIDLSLCHSIAMLVGNENPQTQMGTAYHAFVNGQYDSVGWTWNPPGCYSPSPDAGAPVADAAGDSLPIPPGQGEGGP
jgi:hypothetical protein